MAVAAKNKKSPKEILPPAIKRARQIQALIGCLPDDPQNRTETLAQESFQMLRVAIHDPAFAPCGTLCVATLKGLNLMGDGAVVNDNRTFNFILQMGTEERERFIAEGERKLLEAGKTIEVAVETD